MTPDRVAAILPRLHDANIPCLLFGGWAEEAFGLTPARPHQDIDLLLEAPTFDAVDRFLAGPDAFAEVALKRFAHKRALLDHGLLVEITLIQNQDGVPVTWYCGDVRFAWLTPLSAMCDLGGHRVAVVTPQNLRHHRDRYRQTEPWRWRDATSLILR